VFGLSRMPLSGRKHWCEKDWRVLCLCLFIQLFTHPTHSAPVNDPVEIRLVYGSFADADRASRFATDLAGALTPEGPNSIEVQSSHELGTTTHRVVGPVASAATIALWSEQARALGIETWRLITPLDTPLDRAAVPRLPSGGEQPIHSSDTVALDPPTATDTPNATEIGVAAGGPDAMAGTETPADVARPQAQADVSRRFDAVNFDLDLGVQNRLFPRRGSNTADRAQQSLSAQLSASTEFAGGSNLLALEIFGRWDSDDAQRSHTDLRELSITHIADRWQLQAGVGQVFWGVVEFNHLIDVVNQTDLVENPDGEDKLGQPMVTFTALPDWGSVELYVLPAFRTRTLPGISGRLTFALPIDRGAAEFESGAGKNRVDGLLRVSTQLGGVLFDVYHFNGTRRTPRFEVGERPAGGGTELFLIPNYETVKQTAIAAQANAGDTAFKLEALQQDGGPESYWAAAAGLEHTFVGLLGGSADLGAVVEYHYDSRGRDAFDSFFESDLALGARFAANDINDTQALLGVVWDTSAKEWIVQLEASRRLNDRWSLSLESRWFAGGDAVGSDASVADLLDTQNKLGSVQRDDYIQLEFTRFF